MTKNNGSQPTIYQKNTVMETIIEKIISEIERLKLDAGEKMGDTRFTLDRNVSALREVKLSAYNQACDDIIELVKGIEDSDLASLDEAIMKTRALGGLDTLQEKVNEKIETRRRVLNLVAEARELGGKTFGYLKESFENLSPKLFKSEEGKAVMKKYASAIKENKSLSSLHKLYENIRKAHSGIDFDYFVGTLCETNWNVKPKELNEGMEKLAGIVAEGYIVVGEGAGKYLGTENDRLDGAIEFIAENKVGQKNIVKYSEAVKVIREAVEKNGNIADSFKKETDLDKTIEDLVAKYSKDEYTDQEEIDQVSNAIARSGDEETVFVKKKTECVNSLDEAIKKYSDGNHEEELSTLKKIHEQVSAKSYNPETIGPDICNFVEMSKLFE